jgi:predicted metal-dependent HD superfamily phosphohydrolase
MIAPATWARITPGSRLREPTGRDYLSEVRMIHFNPERWNSLCSSAAFYSTPENCFEDLQHRYAEAHRHYHNSLHIDECLQEFDRARADAQNPVALEFAIWFHDVVYDPRRSDNEERSAEFAEKWLKTPDDLARRIRELILVTKTHLPGAVPDAALLIDIDLSIFGKSERRFSEYENGIRSEYAWVAENVYREKRVAILHQFLKRERIYNTDAFFDLYEIPARRNISNSIAAMQTQQSRAS